jgi:hypothetical protein
MAPLQRRNSVGNALRPNPWINKKYQIVLSALCQFSFLLYRQAIELSWQNFNACEVNAWCAAEDLVVPRRGQLKEKESYKRAGANRVGAKEFLQTPPRRSRNYHTQSPSERRGTSV